MFSFLKRTSLYLLAIPVMAFFVGLALNQVVLIANHDKFPVMVNDRKLAILVSQDAAITKSDKLKTVFVFPARVINDAVMIDDLHCNMTKDTHFNALADIFDMQDAIYSIGDAFILLGTWMWVFAPYLFLVDVIRKLY